MSGSRIRIFAAVLACAALADAGEAPGAYFADQTWGYKIKVPKGWSHAAIPTAELWVASNHLGKRELETAKAKYWVRQRPEMWVVGFPHAREGVDKTYAGYKEYVKALAGFLDWGAGKYEFTAKKETKVDGGRVSIYEIVSKDDSGAHGKSRVLAWVFHFDDIDFAVHFRILEEYYGESVAAFRGCLKSFRRIKRTKALPGTKVDEPKQEDTKGLTPEQLERRRKDETERRFRKEIGALQEGWKHNRSKSFLVLFNAPSKFVRATTAHAEAVQAHLDKLFAERKAGYHPPGVIRIFATGDERNAFRKGVGEESTDVLVAVGYGYVKNNEYEALNQRLLAAWLLARHDLLQEMMPAWLSVGLQKYMSMVRTRGKRITFTNENYGRDAMRLAIKRAEYTDVVHLVGRGMKGVGGGKQLPSDQWNAQAKSFGFWLMTKGNRAKYKDLVPKYISALLAALRNVEAAALKKHEADNAGKKQDPDAVTASDWARADTKEGADHIRQTAFDAVLGKWSGKDWDRFTHAWLSSAK